jgi:hypothetical protein
MHDIIATLLPIPRRYNIRKNKTEKTCGRVLNFAMASGYEMKAAIEDQSISQDFSKIFYSHRAQRRFSQPMRRRRRQVHAPSALEFQKCSSQLEDS